MKTFNITKTDQPIVFTVGKEEFEAIPADHVSARILIQFFQDVNDGNLFKAHDTFLKTVLIKDCHQKFYRRLNCKSDPITIHALGNITAWLIGDEYLGGKSFGRGQAIINFALDSWEEFDSWCLMHGIDTPWKLPSYRFGALVVAYLKDEKMPEGIAQINETLSSADEAPHPFFDPSFRRILRSMGGVLTAPIKKSTTIDNVIYDPRLIDELPVEERKRREAAAKGKPYRVPEWWVGEKKAYKTAKSMMMVLPKKMGPLKD